jgi:hypothetical protein
VTSVETSCPQPLDIPFPRRRERFVEIVNAKDLRSFRCGERSKVYQVSIPTGLDPELRGRRVSQVGCHDRRRAAEEHEGRGNHPSITDRNQLWKPSLVGCFQHFDGLYVTQYFMFLCRDSSPILVKSTYSTHR